MTKRQDDDTASALFIAGVLGLGLVLVVLPLLYAWWMAPS